MNAITDSTKQFAVNWNNHMNHVRKAFDNLLDNSELTDVTLFVEGRKIGSHKMLLSACSAYFKNLFKEFPQEHPIIVLKGVSYLVLRDILKFIYNGEVSVDCEVFDNFLQTAEFLQISGLTDGHRKTVDNDTEQSEELHRTKIVKRSNSEPEHIMQAAKKIKEEYVEECPTANCEPDVLTAIFADELNKQESSHFTPEVLQSASSNNADESNFKIEEEAIGDDYYGRQNTTTSLEETFKCPICFKVFLHPYSLHHHKPVHKGGTKCPICQAVLSRKYNLKMHMKSRHNVCG